MTPFNPWVVDPSMRQEDLTAKGPDGLSPQDRRRVEEINLMNQPQPEPQPQPAPQAPQEQPYQYYQMKDTPPMPMPQPQMPQQQPSGGLDPMMLMRMGAGMQRNGVGGAATAMADHLQLQEETRYARNKYSEEQQYKKEQDKLTNARADKQLEINADKAEKAAQKKFTWQKAGSYAPGWVYRTNPETGDPEWKLETQVAEFAAGVQQKKEDHKTERAQLAAGDKVQAQATSPQATKAFQEKQTQLNTLRGTLQQIDTLQTTMFGEDRTAQPGEGIPFWARGLSAMGTWGENIVRMTPTKAADMVRQVKALNLEGFVKIAEGFNGALSNEEGKQIRSAMVQAGDDPTLWAKFFTEWGPKMQRAYQVVEGQVGAMEKSVAEAQALPSNTNQPLPPKTQQNYNGMPVTPKASGGAPQFGDRASLEAAIRSGQIKKGQRFMGPDGKEYEVQ